MYKNLNEWRQVERPLLDDPDGLELYNILLGNIEHRQAEIESLKIEDYPEAGDNENL